MYEIKDPAFKLFGKTIPVPVNDEIPAKPGHEDEDLVHRTKSAEDEDQSKQKTGESEVEDQAVSVPEDQVEPATFSGVSDNPNSNLTDKETSPTRPQKPEEEQSKKNTSQEKILKKPDRVLPCPRCNSLDTKFCYYNNYNVNQPRHFCKNCQRYWTAGGTMRNVPVGAGRRKNKHSASHYRHITVPNGLQTARPDAPDPVLHQPLEPNGTVLSFGPDVPLCESMASVLNLGDKTIAKRNRSHITEDLKKSGAENGEEHSSSSSVTAMNSTEEGNHDNLQDPVPGYCQGFAPQIPCFTGAPWPSPWNAAQWSAAPAFCASSFPVSFYPATYWGCAIPGPWSIPLLGTGGVLTSPHAPSNIDSSNSGSSSTLGKHSREGNTLQQNNCEKGNAVKHSNYERRLWIPKTLRIDDPDEAAKSSIWATLGIKNDKAELISGGGMFKAFQSKMEEKNHMTDAAQILNANPAALSRSLNFHENL